MDERCYSSDKRREQGPCGTDAAYSQGKARMQVKKKKILVVDDDPDILAFLQVILGEEGYTAVTTDKGD